MLSDKSNGLAIEIINNFVPVERCFTSLRTFHSSKMNIKLVFYVLSANFIYAASENVSPAKNITWNVGIYGIHPFAQLREGKPSGIEVQLLELIASKLDIQITWSCLDIRNGTRAHEK